MKKRKADTGTHQVTLVHIVLQESVLCDICIFIETEACAERSRALCTGRVYACSRVIPQPGARAPSLEPARAQKFGMNATSVVLLTSMSSVAKSESTASRRYWATPNPVYCAKKNY